MKTTIKYHNITIHLNEGGSVGLEVDGLQCKDGPGYIVLLEPNNHGKPVLYVWDSIEAEDPNHIIDLGAASLDNHPDLLHFHCSKCNAKRPIEQVLGDAVVSSTLHVYDGWVEHDCNEVIESAETCRFQCQACGCVIENESGYEISDEEELIEWLKSAM